MVVRVLPILIFIACVIDFVLRDDDSVVLILQGVKLVRLAQARVEMAHLIFEIWGLRRFFSLPFRDESSRLHNLRLQFFAFCIVTAVETVDLFSVGHIGLGNR